MKILAHVVFQIVLFAFCHQTVNGSLIYSVEADADNLVLIDSATGNVTTIGALGFDATDVDLTMLGGSLYALNSNHGSDVTLYQLNALTGATISSASVFQGATQITFAESLANVNGQLKIGYNQVGIFASNTLGTLATNGQVSVVGSSPAFDFDGMGVDQSTNTLHGIDVTSLSPLSNFFTIGESPVSASNYLVNFPNFSNDFAINAGLLYSMDHVDNDMHIIDLSTNMFSTVDITSGGTYLGAAIASVPEPASSAMFITALFALSWQRRKRVSCRTTKGRCPGKGISID